MKDTASKLQGITAIPKPRRTVALNLQGSYILVTISEFPLRHDFNGFSAGSSPKTWKDELQLYVHI